MSQLLLIERMFRIGHVLRSIITLSDLCVGMLPVVPIIHHKESGWCEGCLAHLCVAFSCQALTKLDRSSQDGLPSTSEPFRRVSKKDCEIRKRFTVYLYLGRICPPSLKET